MFDKPVKLSPEQIKFFDDNGYLAVKDILSPVECEFAISLFEYHAKLSQNTEYKVRMNLDRIEEWTKADENYNGFAHMYIRLMLMKRPSIVTMLEILHKVEPSELVVMQSQFLYKKAGTEYSSQSWNPHQDGYYHGAGVGGTLTANINFTDQDRENGCLFIYPGSHKEGFLEAEKKKSFQEGRGNRPGHDLSQNPVFLEKYASREIDLNLQAGSVLFLHGCVIHGSHPNISLNRDRHMLQCPYKTKGLPFTKGNAGDRMEIATR